ncbi:MAG TPA: peroxiredoxin [Stellaceae bacterium]|nr:peroxiredoxin [Stellaceae bacterium]
MKPLRLVSAALGLVAAAVPAYAALKAGDQAPPFTTEASLGGKAFTFVLADALAKGPVVLYFYPAAFTPGCNIEAHDFAEAVGRFAALGATVIGVSHDSIATLNKFSVEKCQGKFPVAADTDLAIARSYNAVLAPLVPYANRTSYVIAPGGKILYAFTDLAPDDHVANTLRAVEAWHAAQKPQN